VMIAAASTRILPSFFTAPGEYSTPQMVGEEIANSKYATDVLMGAFVITNCAKLAGAPIPWRCRTLRTGSLGLTRPRHSRGDVLFANPKLGEFGAYLFDTALMQRTQDDALPIRAHIEIFHAGEAGHHSFGSVIWLLIVFFARIVNTPLPLTRPNQAPSWAIPLVHERSHFPHQHGQL
jgi:hypothetical protein